MKYSFAILKPDSLLRKLDTLILGIIEENGFRIIAKKRFRFTRKEVESVYERAIGQEHFEEMCAFLASGDSIAVLVEHESLDAIRILNDLVGCTDPKESSIGTIRRLGESVRRNLIHSTADKYSFGKEVSIFFHSLELKEIGCEL